MTNPEWKEYTGSDEQIAEMEESCNGILIQLDTIIGKDKSRMVDSYDELIDLGYKNFITHYLICNPHPRADINRPACPGLLACLCKLLHKSLLSPGPWDKAWRKEMLRTNTPDWNIPGAEYSFTPFEDAIDTWDSEGCSSGASVGNGQGIKVMR